MDLGKYNKIKLWVVINYLSQVITLDIFELYLLTPRPVAIPPYFPINPANNTFPNSPPLPRSKSPQSPTIQIPSIPKQYTYIISQHMNEPTEPQPVPDVQKKQSMQDVQKWVRSHATDLRSPDWIRQRYYSKLNIDFPPLEQLQKKQEIANDQVTLNIFVPKSNQEVRQRYFKKLVKMGIMNLQPTKKYQHLFIFDWDDTLLCTSYLSALNFSDIPSQVKQMLKKVDECVEKLLKEAKQRGILYIITNATKGWVQHSSKLYMPLTNALLGDKTITVISARSEYSQEYPNDYGRWKIEAFKSILKKIDSNILTNMICLGDSNIQIEAAHCLGKEFDKVVIKTIKFRENPRPDQMVKQIGLVLEKFREIFDNNKNLTIRLERKK